MIAAIELSNGAIEGIEIEFIDISTLPMYNTDLENNGTCPPLVEAFRYKILQADSVLFASPKYNYSLTGTTIFLCFYIDLDFFFVQITTSNRSVKETKNRATMRHIFVHAVWPMVPTTSTTM